MKQLKNRSQVNIITVPQSFKAVTGEKIGDKYVLGENLGEGMYGAVYDVLVQENNGTEYANLVFKCLKVGQKSEKHGLLREWLINEKLNELDWSEGFMYAEAGVYRENRKFIGMILEKMNGWTVRKRIKGRKFHDINYICYMLQDVFEALQHSQNQLGFHHADLHLGNIMEQHIVTQKAAFNRSKSKKWTIFGLSYDSNLNNIDLYDLENVRFKMIDFGHSWFWNRQNQEMQESQQPQLQQQQPPPQQQQQQQYQQPQQQQNTKQQVNQLLTFQFEHSQLEYLQIKQQQLQDKSLRQEFLNSQKQQLQSSSEQVNHSQQELYKKQQQKEQQQQSSSSSFSRSQEILQSEDLSTQYQQQQIQQQQRQQQKQYNTPFENPDLKQNFPCIQMEQLSSLIRELDNIQIFIISSSMKSMYRKDIQIIEKFKRVTFQPVLEDKNLLAMVVQPKQKQQQYQNNQQQIENLIKERLKNQNQNENSNQNQIQNVQIDEMETIYQEIFQVPYNQIKEFLKIYNFENMLSTKFSSKRRENFELQISSHLMSTANLHEQIKQEQIHREIPNRDSAIMLRTSCTEKAYRVFWRGKGDVYRILLSLAAQIDCRVWDKKDQLLVEILAELIYCVLGVQIFRRYEENLDQKLCMLGKFGLKSTRYRSKSYRWLRTFQIRMRALMFANRPGILAKDALSLWQQIQTQITLNPVSSY